SPSTSQCPPSGPNLPPSASQPLPEPSQYNPVQTSINQYNPVPPSMSQYGLQHLPVYPSALPVLSQCPQCPSQPLPEPSQYKPVQTKPSQYKPVQTSINQYNPVPPSMSQYGLQHLPVYPSALPVLSQCPQRPSQPLPEPSQYKPVQP
ncbi:hypothetical protein N339_05408, partial [Pterocles gutturalis]